jgi:hypothetical protein
MVGSRTGTFPRERGIRRSFTITSLTAGEISSQQLADADIEKFAPFNSFILNNRSGQLLSVVINGDTTNVYFVPPATATLIEDENIYRINVKNEESSSALDTNVHLTVRKI